MPKIFKNIIAIIIAISCTSCTTTVNEKNDIAQTTKNSETDITGQYEINVENMWLNNLISVQNGSILYAYYKGKGEGSSLIFHKYNILKDKDEVIGTFMSPYIDSGDIVVNKEKIYMYCDRLMSVSDQGVTIKNFLYELNLKDDRIKKIAEDTTGQTLIYIDNYEDTIFSLKGKIDNRKGVTYIDTYNTKKSNNSEFTNLIFKEFNRDTKSGEIIYNFAQDNKKLYLFVVEENKGKVSSIRIEVYDLAGKKIKDIELDKKTFELLKNERISKFTVISNYGFIRTYAGSGVLFDISADTIKPVIFNDVDLDIATSSASVEKDSNMILYSRDTNEVWCLDALNKKIKQINIPCSKIRNICIDNNDYILVYSDTLTYRAISSYPVISERELQ